MAKGIRFKKNNENAFVDKFYRVGDLYLTTNSTNPSTIFGGTWELFGPGKTLVCVDTSDGDFNTVKKTGGNKSLQSHTHSWSGTTSGDGNHAHSVYSGYGSGGGYGQDAFEFKQNLTSRNYYVSGTGAVQFISTAGAHTHTISNITENSSSSSVENIVDGNNTGAIRNINAFADDRLHNTNGIGQSYEAGKNSSSLGTGTITETEGALAIGKYNKSNGRFAFEDETQPYAFMIGNGTGDAIDNRSNVHTVGTDGAAWFAKDVYVGGTDIESGKKLVTVDDLNNLSNSNDTDDYMKVYRVVVESEDDLTINNTNFTSAIKKMVADLKSGRFSGISISVINNTPDLTRFCGIYTLDTGDIWNSSLSDNEEIKIKTPVSYELSQGVRGTQFIERQAVISFEMNNGEVSQLTPDLEWLVNSKFVFLAADAPENNTNVQYEPTYNNHPTNKYYVDKEIKKLADRITALENGSSN